MFNRNQVELIGHIASNPEVRSLDDGKKVLNLRIATNESWKDKKSGERHERTEFTPIVIWRPSLIDFVEKHVRKGAYVLIEAKLQNRAKEKDGEKVYQIDVVGNRLSFCEAKDGGDYQDDGDQPQD
jgi:single-strand DNA-binding protein|nr:single-stranded DNA-binding protein [uncultured Dongia sp.]